MKDNEVKSQLQTVMLKPNVSLIEVMRRFRRSAGTILIRATHTRSNGSIPGYWNLQFIGNSPDLYGLTGSLADLRVPPKHTPVYVE